MTSKLKTCPYCGGKYDRLMAAEGKQRCCPHCLTVIKMDMKKTCPRCQDQFTHARKTVYRGVTSRVCPFCETPIHYRRIPGSKVAVILMDDKLCVDALVRIICTFHQIEPEATQKERKLAYDLVDWVKGKEDSIYQDLGMDAYQFLEEMVKWVLSDGWWADHFSSLTMLWNSKSRLALDFSRHLRLERQLALPNDDQLGRSFEALKEKLHREAVR